MNIISNFNKIKKRIIIPALLVFVCLPNNLFSQEYYPEQRYEFSGMTIWANDDLFYYDTYHYMELSMLLPPEFIRPECREDSNIKGIKWREKDGLTNRKKTYYYQGYCSYDSNGRLPLNLPTSETTIIYGDSTEVTDTIIYKIDSAGMLRDKIKYIRRRYGDIDTSSYSYQYSKNGDCIQVLYYYNNVLKIIFYFTYDDKNRLIEKREVTVYEGGFTTKEEGRIFIFAGERISMIIGFKDKERDILFYYKYSEKDRCLTEYKRERKTGEYSIKRKIHYSESGKVLLEEIFGVNRKYTVRIYTEYDERDNPVFMHSVCIKGNFLKDELFTEWGYDERNSMISMKKYDRAGNILSWKFSEYEYYK